MKKVTKKVILNTTKDFLHLMLDQLEIDRTKKTKKLIDKVAIKFSSGLKNEVAKQLKERLKSKKARAKRKKTRKKIPVQ